MDNPYFTGLIISILSLMIIIHEFRKGKNKWFIIISLSIGILVYFLIYKVMNRNGENSKMAEIFILFLFGIITSSYTIFQWNRDIDIDGGSCNILTPTSGKFLNVEYSIYRGIYFISLIVVMVLSLILLKKGKIKTLLDDNLYYIIILLPIISPILTELSNYITDKLFTPSTIKLNPESLLVNFITGGDIENYSHIVASTLLYLTLIILIIIYGLGLMDVNQTNIPIIILMIMVIFFSMIMKLIFIQDCSLEEEHDISNESINNNFLCNIEKYGGIQLLLCISLLSIVTYKIENDRDKLIGIFIMIALIWGLSETFMNILK